MSLTSPRVRVQLERLSHPTRVINVASQQGSSCSACVVCVCVCVGVFVCVTAYSIIGPVGDGGSCGHKLTWNFLNKGLIFTGSCTVLEGVSPRSLISSPSRSHQRYSVSTYTFLLCVCVVSLSDLEVSNKKGPGILCGQKYVDIQTLHPGVIVECLILNPLALTCCYNSFRSSGKVFHEIAEPGCRDLLPFGHRRIIEVGQ